MNPPLPKPVPPKHQPYLYHLAMHRRRHVPMPALLKDGRPFTWDSVTRVRLREGGMAWRYVVEKIEKRHLGIKLGMGGVVFEADLGARLIFDDPDDGVAVDYIDYTPLFPIDLRSKKS